MKKKRPNNRGRRRTAAGRFAKKSLGQNFLIDAGVREAILDAGGDLQAAHVLEIGPGLGALTKPLLDRARHLTAVELDQRAVRRLTTQLGGRENFTLIPADFLDWDLGGYFGEKPYVCIANIPYNITNPIIRKLLSDRAHQPEFALLMVQKEVGEKICCKKGKRSILSLSVEIYATAEIVVAVPRGCFDPVPGVDSVVIKLTVRPEPLVPLTLERDFFTVVQAGFAQRRKKLGNALGSFFGDVGPGASRLLGEIDPNRRAETLTVAEWMAVAERLGVMKD